MAASKILGEDSARAVGGGWNSNVTPPPHSHLPPLQLARMRVRMRWHSRSGGDKIFNLGRKYS